MTTDIVFIEALRNSDLQIIKSIPKSDLHNHSLLGGNIKDVSKIMAKELFALKKKVNSVKEMAAWTMDQFPSEIYCRDGILQLTACALKNAQTDGIKNLEMSIDSDMIDMFLEDDLDSFIEDILKIKNQIASSVEFKPELGIQWDKNPDDLYNRINNYFKADFFKSIDLYGLERGQPIEIFQELFETAHNKGLKLKAHVGEFGTPDDIVEVVEGLNLDSVQHGISAANSKDVMKYLSEKNIILNVCPTSNVLLSRVKSIDEHPIRILYDNNVKVTINSDDMLIFDSSVSEEYLKLYQCGLMSAEELNEIRKFGLAS